MIFILNIYNILQKYKKFDQVYNIIIKIKNLI